VGWPGQRSGRYGLGNGPGNFLTAGSLHTKRLDGGVSYHFCCTRWGRGPDGQAVLIHGPAPAERVPKGRRGASEAASDVIHHLNYNGLFYGETIGIQALKLRFRYVRRARRSAPLCPLFHGFYASSGRSGDSAGEFGLSGSEPGDTPSGVLTSGALGVGAISGSGGVPGAGLSSGRSGCCTAQIGDILVIKQLRWPEVVTGACGKTGRRRPPVEVVSVPSLAAGAAERGGHAQHCLAQRGRQEVGG
jgi:hypothetical protein